MRFHPVIAIGIANLILTSAVQADDTPVKGKIVSVDLFKNGLAVVKYELTVGKAGNYILSDVPQPIHGSFYIEGTAKAEATLKTIEVDVPVADADTGNLQDDLAGKRVTVQLKGANRPPVEGTVLKLKPAKNEDPSQTAIAEEPRQKIFLLLQSERGRIYLDTADISSVAVTEAKDATVKRQQPRLVLTVIETNQPETKLALRYLTNGLSWAPSYRVDISDPKSLVLEQHAVVRNELANLDGAEVRLISGYPSVQFAQVRSLLGPRTTLANFFNELNNRQENNADAMSNSTVGLQMAGQGFGGFRSPIGTTLGATPTGEGVDLHFQPIGKRTITKGDSLGLTVAKGKANYQRIVEWLSLDHRDTQGRYAERERNNENEDAWDALKFKNPLSFPMSTGPASVTANGSFNGQRTSFWVNPGEETILRVEKSMSVRTRATENEKLEKVAENEQAWVGRHNFRKVTVEGELAVSNNRKEAIQMVIRRRFSGELVKAELEPKNTLLTDGVYSVNKRNELVWTLQLKGGEERTIKYSYVVLVWN